MAKWKGNGSAQELRIGDIQAVAGVNGTAIVYASVERTAPRQLGLDAAKSAAEQALREMHNALAEHFAPVLRWEDIHPSLSTARLGEWMIDVTNGGWYLFVRCEDGRRLVRHAVTIEVTGENVSHAERKRVAEAALRALGVTFRVEGES